MHPTHRPTPREHATALLLALGCAVLFLRSALLPSNALVPHPPELFDVWRQQAIAAGNYDPADAARGNVGMADKYVQSLCWDRVLHDRLRAGELPRWTNDIGGGAAFVPQMAQPYQPIDLLLLLLPSAGWYGVWYLIHQVLFGWFAYAFVRRLGCTHGAGLVALVAATLGLWTQCKLHHNVILTAALSLWPMLSATHELVVCGATGRARRFAIGWLALWTGLSWSTGFVVVALQASYLTCGAAVLWAFAGIEFAGPQAERPRGERLRRLAPVAIGFALGGLLACANMLPVLLASAQSARGEFDAARLMALGLEWDHLLGLVWPDLLSQAADRFYAIGGDPGAAAGFLTRLPWSQLVLLHDPLRPENDAPFQLWVETSWAIGLVPLGCAATALWHKAQRPLAIAATLGVLLAFAIATGAQPWFTIARVLPGICAGDLRRLLFAASMLLVLLSGLGADVVLREARQWPLRTLLVAAALVSATMWLWFGRLDDDAFVQQTAAWIAADRDHPQVAAVGGDVAFVEQWIRSGMMPGEATDNRAMLTTTVLRTLLVATLALLLTMPRTFTRRWRLGGWLALTIAELWHCGLGPVQTVPTERITTLPGVLQPLAAAAPANGDRPRLCRLLPPGAGTDLALPANLPGALGVEDCCGYNPLPPARYEQFFAAIDASCVFGGAGVGAFHSVAALRHPLCDLYGARFVLTPLALPTDDALVDRTPPGTGGYHLYERTTVLPRATFVQQVDVIPDEALRRAALAAADRDVAHRVVLEHADAPAPDSTRPAAATCTIVDRRDERVAVQVRTDAAGYLRLADPWHAGWTATLDGQRTEIHVADHYLRAVFVPAGEHEVVFRFDGPQVVWPERLSLLALLAIAALLSTGTNRRNVA